MSFLYLSLWWQSLLCPTPESLGQIPFFSMDSLSMFLYQRGLSFPSLNSKAPGISIVMTMPSQSFHLFRSWIDANIFFLFFFFIKLVKGRDYISYISALQAQGGLDPINHDLLLDTGRLDSSGLVNHITPTFLRGRVANPTVKQSHQYHTSQSIFINRKPTAFHHPSNWPSCSSQTRGFIDSTNPLGVPLSSLEWCQLQ